MQYSCLNVTFVSLLSTLLYQKEERELLSSNIQRLRPPKSLLPQLRRTRVAVAFSRTYKEHQRKRQQGAQQGKHMQFIALFNSTVLPSSSPPHISLRKGGSHWILHLETFFCFRARSVLNAGKMTTFNSHPHHTVFIYCLSVFNQQANKSLDCEYF